MCYLGTGIDDINSAFDGSLTFQPALPSGDVEFVVSFQLREHVSLSSIICSGVV